MMNAAFREWEFEVMERYLERKENLPILQFFNSNYEVCLFNQAIEGTGTCFTNNRSQQ